MSCILRRANNVWSQIPPHDILWGGRTAQLTKVILPQSFCLIPSPSGGGVEELRGKPCFSLHWRPLQRGVKPAQETRKGRRWDLNHIWEWNVWLDWTFNNFSENVWKAMASVQDIINNQEKVCCRFQEKLSWFHFFSPTTWFLSDVDDDD